MEGSSVWWPLHKLARQIQHANHLIVIALLVVAARVVVSHPEMVQELAKVKGLPRL